MVGVIADDRSAATGAATARRAAEATYTNVEAALLLRTIDGDAAAVLVSRGKLREAACECH